MAERHNDGPVQAMADEANRVCDQYPGSLVWQKWTCGHCGSRQIMDEPNTFYASGTCEACGKVSTIEHCGFGVVIPGDADTAAILGAATRKDHN